MHGSRHAFIHLLLVGVWDAVLHESSYLLIYGLAKPESSKNKVFFK